MGKLDYILKYKNYIDNIYVSNKEDDIDLYNESKNVRISEGLIKTFPTKNTISILQKRFPSIKISYTGEEIVVSNNTTYLSEYIPLINNLGYYISQVYNGKEFIKDFREDKIYSEFVLEAKFDIEVKVPKILYHSTHKKNLDKILKHGLYPKSESKLSAHPDRIYLTDDYKTAYDFSKYIRNFYGKNPFYENDSIIFEIDTNGLDIRLYKDINLSETGYYTIDNISPKNIKIYEKN